jgi:ribosomal protein S18 acetylase RimI-like enzyme
MNEEASPAHLGGPGSLTVRPATDSDRADLRLAIVVLQDHERGLHPGTAPGERVADAYLAWMLERARGDGSVLVAESDGRFAGFCAGWIETDDSPAELPECRRHGWVSDVCVMPSYRGQRIAARLLVELERHLAARGATRLRLAVLTGNEVARRSYAREGFAPFETIYEKRIEVR